MKDRLLLGIGLLVGGILLIDAPTGAGETGATACGADYHCMRDLMFHYRSQATDLKMMAEHYEREAALKAKELGKDAAEVKKTEEKAKKFWAQAQEADQLAREYQYQLPHNAY
jgi:hypothetical protein